MAVPMRPFSCAEARQEAVRRLFEPLEPHTEATLAGHLAVCDDCQAHADDTARAARLLGSSLVGTDPPGELEARVLEAVRGEPSRRVGRRRRVWTAALAAALVMAGVALIVVLPGPGRGGQATLSPADRVPRAQGSAVIEGPAGSHRLRINVTGLPDLAEGSAYAVWLGDGRGTWRRLGQFRRNPAELFYPLPEPQPELVRVTIEWVDADPASPGFAVLTGRF